MKEILIICAMEKESKTIAQELKLQKVTETIFKKNNISLLISGIGKQKTAINLTKYLCENIKPDLIVNIGYAGSTDIKIGTWVNITKSYNYEWDIPGEEKYSFLDYGNQELELTKNTEIQKVECYSAESFVTKTDLTGHLAFDMELHSVAVIGDMFKIPVMSLKKISDNLSLEDYYDNTEITIPLDPTLTARENAQKFFDKYNKQKRTFEAVTEQLSQTRAEIDHLESISTSMDIARLEEDLVQIKEELIEYGYIRRKRTDKKAKSKSKPFHYRSSDGYDIYVGKNNYQNEELTFKFVTGNDWWFHAKKMPGSHVIVKNKGGEMPDRVFEEAGKLAGYYSSGRDSDKLEIDYLQKKNVKKPAGSAPGFVVYYTNYSLTIHPDISGLTLVESSNT